MNVLNSEDVSNNVIIVQDSSAACKTYEYHKLQHKVTPLPQWGIQITNSKNFKNVINTLKFQRDTYRSKNNAYD